ncbi:hypothetical protein GPALN_011535 [Globodera pallida]|nr:hypothetical protein GPALN_011535 [Globodera pallida]
MKTLLTLSSLLLCLSLLLEGCFGIICRWGTSLKDRPDKNITEDCGTPEKENHCFWGMCLTSANPNYIFGCSNDTDFIGDEACAKFMKGVIKDEDQSEWVCTCCIGERGQSMTNYDTDPSTCPQKTFSPEFVPFIYPDIDQKNWALTAALNSFTMMMMMIGLKAPGRERQKAPGRERQKAPGRERQKAPGQERQKAPGRERQKAPGRERQKAPGRERQKAPGRERQKAPGRERQKAPGRERQKAPGRERQKAPGRERHLMPVLVPEPVVPEPVVPEPVVPEPVVPEPVVPEPVVPEPVVPEPVVPEPVVLEPVPVVLEPVVPVPVVPEPVVPEPVVPEPVVPVAAEMKL